VKWCTLNYIYQGQVAIEDSCTKRHILSIGEKNPFLSFQEQIINARKKNFSWSIHVNACAIAKKEPTKILFLTFN
jgi:hypothetical protein